MPAPVAPFPHIFRRVLNPCCDVRCRAMVLINPGNPTGQVLSAFNLEEVIDFCQKERLVLLADEVYQTNIYNPKKPFHSCKSILKKMG